VRTLLLLLGFIIATALAFVAVTYLSLSSAPVAPAAPERKPVLIDCGPLIQEEAELVANQVKEEFSKQTKELDEKLARLEQSNQPSPLQCTCHGGCKTHCNSRLKKGKQ
jgi:hypothetical protein